ncbi:MAG TPA: ABC transporter substrate-binding protein [Acetobacteraceae bacterium]|nr:ABC transporter substrate-binding protein [Acetobacteraceae bacterium]
MPFPALAQPDSAPAAPVSALYAGLEAVMREGASKPFTARFAQLAPVITQAFDLTAILMHSVGLHWASLADAARARLFKAFSDFTVASYVANFDEYSGQKFEILPEQRSVGADRVVASRIVRASGNTVRIDYLVHQDGPRWRITDVLLDGTISRVAVQRSDFRSLLDRGGAEALIASLQSKTADLSGGARLSVVVPPR